MSAIPDAEALRQSPLADRHRALGAHLTAFAGWEMPLDYGSVLAEHRRVRSACGMFDLSHLGTLRVSGGRAAACLRLAFSNDATALAPGRAHYTLCLDEHAGIVDDLLVYHLPDAFLVVPNAANTAAVQARLSDAAARTGATSVGDVTDNLACIAVQGPAAAEVLATAGVDVDGMAYLDCRPLPEGGPLGVLARSGYTGERGYELFVDASHAATWWDRLHDAGAAPAGLGARDTLRLEMGYPLHGNDISVTTTPQEAGLAWAVKADAPFAGRDAYLRAEQTPPRRRLRGLRALARGVPRAHCPVRAGEEVVGDTTSGTFSPTLERGIALAYLTPQVAVGDTVAIEVRGRMLPAEVVRPPFVPASPR